MSRYVEGIEFVTEHCCNCHMPFAMTAAYYRKRLADHKSFYCPAGHGQHYTGLSEESKLKAELERNRQMLEAQEARAARAQQERDEIQRAHSRMRARVMNGVCPCCNRTFQNLLKHMRTEHAEDLTLRNLREAFGMTQTALAKEIGVKPSYVSNFENERYVPEYAKRSIDNWMTKQESGSLSAKAK